MRSPAVTPETLKGRPRLFEYYERSLPFLEDLFAHKFGPIQE
jgi:hypothetical protein